MIRGQDLVDENSISDLEALLSESELAKNVKDANEIEIALKSNVVEKSLPLFEIELILAAPCTNALEFAPNELLLKTRLENMLFDSLNVVSKPTRLLTHEEFEAYVEASVDESGPIGDVIEVREWTKLIRKQSFASSNQLLSNPPTLARRSSTTCSWRTSISRTCLR
jgi:hypothetical protein